MLLIQVPTIPSSEGVSGAATAQIRVTEPGKDLYAVFLKGPDASFDAQYYKILVVNNHLSPGANFDGELLAFTIEASPNEASRLQGNPGIDRVTKLELPADNTSKPEQKEPLTQENYLIYPVDCGNQDQWNATGKALDALAKGTLCLYQRGGMCKKWLAKLTPDQADQAKGIDGVESVKKVTKTKQRSPKPRRKNPTQCAIYPLDGHNPDQVNATGAALKRALGDKLERRGWGEPCWVGSLTKDEIQQAKSIDGISHVKKGHMGRRGGQVTIHYTNEPHHEKCLTHRTCSTDPVGLDQCNTSGPALKDVPSHELENTGKEMTRDRGCQTLQP